MANRSKRQDRLCEERNSAIEPIPTEWLKRMREEMDETHRIYYKKSRTKVEMMCSRKDMGKTLYRHQQDMFDGKKYVQQDPKHNEIGKCPICGKYGKFISIGKAKACDRDVKLYTLYEKWDEDGLVARHIEATRRYDAEQDSYSYAENVEEYARTFLKIGQKPQIDYYKYDGYARKCFWDYKNLYGMYQIQVTIGKELNYLIMRKAPWKYAIDLKLKMNMSYIQTLNFLKAYAEYPEIELMYKSGMKNMAMDIVVGSCIKKYKKKEIWKQYGVTREHWNYVREHDEGILTMRALQENDVNGYGCTTEQVLWFKKNIYIKLDKTIFELTTPEKLINYIKKQARAEDGYRTANDTYRHYVDYINHMRQMGYDLSNTVYLFPKDLRLKHDEAAHRLAVQQDAEKKRQKDIEFENISKKYEKLTKKYAYEDGEFIIRPAMSASEIITEGRELHHCVGGDNYLQSHAKGKSYILLMRRRKNPNIPFCTVEIRQNKILQWYEAHDQKPDKEIIQTWLDNYINHLKEEKHGADGVKLAAG